MRWAELLLLGLVLWTAIGVVGTTVRLARGERRLAGRGLLTIAVVWLLYLLVLMAVSWRQPVGVVPPGKEVCFDEMCFAVEGADEVEGFWARGQERARLVRVKVRIANRGKGRTESEALLRAFLVDEQGRRWDEVRGLGGVRLTARVAAGDTVLSEPVFRVSKDSTGLGLVLTHGRWQPGVLVIGDSDSLLHRPTVMQLGQ